MCSAYMHIFVFFASWQYALINLALLVCVNAESKGRVARRNGIALELSHFVFEALCTKCEGGGDSSHLHNHFSAI